ncbi:MAG: substrate-binding domain-containing protein, partial [Stellaceae bacterium]
MIPSGIADAGARVSRLATAGLLAAAVLAGGLAQAPQAVAATQLTGAGSTFDYPFFSKAFYEYNQKHPDVRVNYQSIGSGGGIQQF